LRTITDAQGTVDCTTANSASVPKRIVPSRSASLPIMKPGSSTKQATGRWKVSHRSTKRRTLRAPSAVMAPA
jgi:hypothetical protein